MVGKRGGRPAGVGGMAGGAIGRKAEGCVVGVDGLVVIGGMAGYAGIGRALKPAGMTPGAIRDIVSFCQREKIMGGLIGEPFKAIDMMALTAIGRKPGTRMVGAGSGRIIR